MYHRVTILLSDEEYARLEALTREDAAEARRRSPDEEIAITPESTATTIVVMYLAEQNRRAPVARPTNEGD